MVVHDSGLWKGVKSLQCFIFVLHCLEQSFQIDHVHEKYIKGKVKTSPEIMKPDPTKYLLIITYNKTFPNEMVCLSVFIKFKKKNYQWFSNPYFRVEIRAPFPNRNLEHTAPNSLDLK